MKALLVKTLSARRLAAVAIVMAAPLALGACGLSNKSYSYFDNYNASQQQASATDRLDMTGQERVSNALKANSMSSQAATQATTPSVSPLALTEMRDHLNQQANQLLQSGHAVCDPFADATASATATAAAADACTQHSQ